MKYILTNIITLILKNKLFHNFDIHILFSCRRAPRSIQYAYLFDNICLLVDGKNMIKKFFLEVFFIFLKINYIHKEIRIRIREEIYEYFNIYIERKNIFQLRERPSELHRTVHLHKKAHANNTNIYNEKVEISELIKLSYFFSYFSVAHLYIKTYSMSIYIDE